jgi:ElaB/YqjD/DUF883 family membrane-anchored ribosome-binding protein
MYLFWSFTTLRNRILFRWLAQGATIRDLSRTCSPLPRETAFGVFNRLAEAFALSPGPAFLRGGLDTAAGRGGSPRREERWSMADSDLSKEIETLRADVAKLRTDLSGIAVSLKDLGKGRVKEELRKGMEGARDRGKKSVETVEQQIEQRPLLALLAAFGVGVVLGKILDRR